MAVWSRNEPWNATYRCTTPIFITYPLSVPSDNQRGHIVGAVKRVPEPIHFLQFLFKCVPCDQYMSVPFPNQIVWSERFELVEETVYLPARDSWVLGESHELLGWTWLEIIQGHDWELDRHVVWAVVKRTEGGQGRRATYKYVRETKRKSTSQQNMYIQHGLRGFKSSYGANLGTLGSSTQNVPHENNSVSGA